jgi:hypothetical protein
MFKNMKQEKIQKVNLRKIKRARFTPNRRLGNW